MSDGCTGLRTNGQRWRLRLRRFERSIERVAGEVRATKGMLERAAVAYGNSSTGGMVPILSVSLDLKLLELVGW